MNCFFFFQLHNFSEQISRLTNEVLYSDTNENLILPLPTKEKGLISDFFLAMWDEIISSLNSRGIVCCLCGWFLASFAQRIEQWIRKDLQDARLFTYSHRDVFCLPILRKERFSENLPFYISFTAIIHFLLNFRRKKHFEKILFLILYAFNRKFSPTLIKI